MGRSAFIVAVAVLSCAMAVESSARNGVRWRGGGGWGPGASYGRTFDPSTVETISGTVASVDLIMPRKGMSSGVHLVVETADGALSVHLGPEWYISRQDTRIESGDRVEVKGSRVVFKGEDIIVAAQVRKGDVTLVLRDEGGVPVWSGWRRGR